MVTVTVHAEGITSTFTLPPPSPAASEAGCAADILLVLSESDRRLSAPEILREFEHRGIPWSERTLKRYLAQLMADGKISNPSDASPRGYGLP